MRKEFTKQDLLTGDIVVTRCGQLGVIILEKDIILYQNAGMDVLSMYTDDLQDETDEVEGADWDIMEVYRAEGGGAISFYDYKDCDPIYERVVE